MPPQGWLNDPNGLCEMNGIYHIFYQYSFDVHGGLKHWGHYTTKDFIHYTIEDIPLYPEIDATNKAIIIHAVKNSTTKRFTLQPKQVQ